MNRSPRRLLNRAGALAIVGLATSPFFAAGSAHAAAGFTSGDLVVYRVGNGSAALSSAATPVYLDEYATTASTGPAFSLPLSTPSASGVNPVTASGTATSEGELTLTADGSHLLATGYDTTPGTASVSATASSAVPREIAEVDGSGDVDTSTALTSQYSGNNIRSAASSDGLTLDAAGPTNGVVQVAKGASTGTQLTPASGVVNFRQAAIFGGQLYASSASGAAVGIDTITNGSATPLPGLDTSTSNGGGSPYSFVLLNATGGTTPDTAYVADAASGAILKYVLGTSGTWMADGSASSPATAGLTGLTATQTNGEVALYATSPTSLVTIGDIGQGPLSGSPVTLATAPANEAFRGVAFAPSGTTPAPSTPEAPAIILLPLAGAALIGGYAVLRSRRTPTR